MMAMVTSGTHSRHDVDDDADVHADTACMTAMMTVRHTLADMRLMIIMVKYSQHARGNDDDGQGHTQQLA